jgi:hypothetical protein
MTADNVDQPTVLSANVAPVDAWSKKVTEPGSERSKKVTAIDSKYLSKKVTRRRRRSDSRDMQTLKKIQRFRVPADMPIEPSLVDNLAPPISTPVSVPLDNPIPDNDNTLPVWEHSLDRIKLAASTWALELSEKHPVSWTLNLTPERIDEAQRDPRGFTESLKRDLDRALQRELGGVHPLYWFSVDVTRKPDERLHLHGAIAADLQELEAIERAMRHVGGHGPKPDKDDHMVDLNPQRCDEGWAVYSIRNAGQVRKLIRYRTTTITSPLRSEGKWFYDTVRQIIGAARK